MKSYIIIYQTTLAESFYTNLVSYLKTAPRWARLCTNTWIIKTTVDATTIRDGVRDRLAKDDKVFVKEIAGGNWATFNISKEITDWIKRNL